jgi:hypothetical protein
MIKAYTAAKKIFDLWLALKTEWKIASGVALLIILIVIFI